MFKDTTSIIYESLRFKAKLAIGEDAYTSLRVKNTVYEAWDALGVASTAATVAKSSVIASTFFAPSGFLAALGIGTAATPLGWVVAAAVISGSTWASVSRYVKKQSNNKVTVIPKFINTPLDVLALGLFDLMAPLALKIAEIDGSINPSKKQFISRYFIKEWGYSESFVMDAISLTENNLSNFSIKELACSIAKFQKDNPDCNYKEMSKEIISFLNRIMETNGKMEEREEMAIEKIENIFKDAEKLNISKNIRSGVSRSLGYVKSILKNGILPAKSNKTHNNRMH